jgi:GxxExxY protein
MDDRLESIAHQVIGSAIEVHKIRSAGCLESVSEDAWAVALAIDGLKVAKQVNRGRDDKGRRVGEGRPDLRVEHRPVVELKAVDDLAPIHTAQAIACLKATNRQLGLVINFNSRVLKEGIKRIAL